MIKMMMGAYYTTLTPFEGSGLYAGTLVNAEATADMGGLKAVLRLAEKEKDFDYDLFFRLYANLWKTNVPMEYEKLLIAGDVHPLAFSTGLMWGCSSLMSSMRPME